MKEKDQQSKNKIASQINDLANIMSRVVENLEMRISEIEGGHGILTNQLSNLSNRVNYLEKKVLK